MSGWWHIPHRHGIMWGRRWPDGRGRRVFYPPSSSRPGTFLWDDGDSDDNSVENGLNGAGPSLRIAHLDMHLDTNSRDHRTSRFSAASKVLVVRRGQAFSLGIRLDRPVPSYSLSLLVELKFGPRPTFPKGTRVQLEVRGTSGREFTRAKDKWDVRVRLVDKSTLQLQVQVPGKVPVGEWTLEVFTDRGAPAQSTSKMYILFNPWSSEDTVYMEDEKCRQEYVLNDVGKIYVGTYVSPRGRKWVYGQFEAKVLAACLFLLERSKLDPVARASPVKVVRTVAAMVNSLDDDGVVIGSWSGQYGDGTAPWLWTGSAAILTQYMKSGGEPVKYGQCWVFAGVCTTVLRALGIPCRTVSNFVSAHDTDDTLTIDKYFDKEGEEIMEYNTDSVWNFHVWNDCWMARPDLPVGYGGWQTVDSTPQETSEGIYRVGPTPVLAVRRGEIGLQYDCQFVFAEVNADIVHWRVGDDRRPEKLSTNKYHVGRSLLTKRVGIMDDRGERDAENITDLYKDREGSAEERMAVLNAARLGGVASIFELPAPGTEDVRFDLVDIEKVMIGKPFRVAVRVTNLAARESRSVTAAISASSVYYTGVVAQRIARDTASFVLYPRQEELLSVTVQPEQYLDKLVEYSMVKVYALATVRETRQTWAEEDDFYVDKPRLDIQVLGEPLYARQQFRLFVKMTNPLDKWLENCIFTVEGPGITFSRKMKYRDIRPRETVVVEMRLSPRKAGSTTLVVVFNCTQLVDISGSVPITVLP